MSWVGSAHHVHNIHICENGPPRSPMLELAAPISPVCSRYGDIFPNVTLCKCLIIPNQDSPLPPKTLEPVVATILGA